MYGKFFASTFTGSMYGAGGNVFALWGYVIAHAVDGQVELNPRQLAPTLGISLEEVQEALNYLLAEDPESRSKEHGGCRLVRVGQFSYEVPTHKKYRSIRNEEERREYNREAKRKERARKAESNVNAPVNDLSAVSAQAVSSIQKQIQEKPMSKSVKKPTVSDDGFDLLWKACAKRVGKAAARKAWEKARKSGSLPSVEQVVEKLVELQASEEWTKDGRQYQPHLATWLNRGGWDDEVGPELPDLLPNAERNKVYDFDGKLIWDNGKTVEPS